MLARSAALTCSLVVSLLVACGSDTGGSDVAHDVVFSDTPGVPIEDVCELRARACCFVELCLSGSEATTRCIKVQQDACTLEIIGPVGNSSDVDYDPKRAGVCLQHYLEGTCEDLTAITGNVPDECREVWVGRRAAGEACTSDIACQPGHFCRPGASGECPGTCAVDRTLGEACDGTTLCGAELTCSARDGAGTCVPASVPTGGSCLPALFSQCPRTDFCDATTSRCVARLPEGAACPSNNMCALSTYCDFTTKLCVRTPTLGEACEFTCGGGTVCAETSNTCVALPTMAGQPCLGPSRNCGFGANLYCDTATNTCVPKVGDGTACGAEFGTGICDYGYCDGDFQTRGVCRPYKAAGQACEGFNQCGPLSCENGVCRLATSTCRGVVTLNQCYF